jgi:23S rRNA (cytosine1962-C5)-methyltransferase
MRHPYPKILLKPGREITLRKGHPWIFSGALGVVEGKPAPGDIVLAATHTGEPLALGFFNPASDIAFRLVTHQTHLSADDRFWQDRISGAMALRQRLIPPNTTACRLINAEGDGIPGLIVDRYGDFLVISIETAGAEKYRGMILEALCREVHPEGIFERSEGRARQREGLPARTGVALGAAPPDTIEIRENGLDFAVDIRTGQKTGFFLDQRDSRDRIGRISRNAGVLNCFSYTGGFSVYCAGGGAKRVVSVETSGPANLLARRNIERNGFSVQDHPIIQADVFEYLREAKDRFDLVILDPPSFAKSRKDVARAARGYKEINLQAIRRLSEGGILATFSCSNYLDETLFEKIVLAAARDAGREAQLVARLGPGPDHPVSLAHPEGRYLKGLLLRLPV